jgi:superfamily II DNA/RNA helicase
MFSATMPPEIRRLADAFLSAPREVQATPPATTAAGVEDHVTLVPARDKFQVLRRLIETQEVDKALIFCNRKREVASLRRQLERAGLNVRDIHGDLEQAQRTQALEAFKRGEIDFLVATDVAARGLDIVSLPCVINYDVPTHADDYVHRIGRTGRAGQAGRAFTLMLPEERRYVDAITKLTGKDIPRLELPAVEPAANGETAPARPGRARNGARAHAKPALSGPNPAERAPAAGRGSARPGGRSDQASAKPAPAEPDALEHSPKPPRSPRRAARPERPTPAQPARAAGPVVGMGDHVPLFMRRAVPNVELLAELTDD